MWDLDRQTQKPLIIEDEDRKSWDPRAPILDNFPIVRTNCPILTTYIRADPRICRGFARECFHVAWSNGDSCEILLRIFHRDGREYEPGLIHVVLCSELMEKVRFSGLKTRLQFRAVNEYIIRCSLFRWPGAHHVTYKHQNGLLMRRPSKRVFLQIIFCSCAIGTTFSWEKWQIATLSCHEVIKIWKQTWWSNDKTIIDLRQINLLARWRPAWTTEPG